MMVLHGVRGRCCGNVLSGICSVLFVLVLASSVVVAHPSSITFHGLENFALLAGKVAVRVSSSLPAGTKYLSLYIDEAHTYTAVNSEFLEYIWDTNKVENGLHTLMAVATDGSGAKFKKRILVNVNNVFENMNVLFSEPGLEKIYHVISLPGGGFIMVGEIRLEDGTTDVLVVKLDENGRLEWFKVFGGPGDDKGTYVVLRPDGSILLCGTFTTEKGDTDILLALLSPNGELLWTKIFGGPADDVAYMIKVLPDGSIVLLILIDGESAIASVDDDGDIAIVFSAGSLKEPAHAFVYVPERGFLLIGGNFILFEEPKEQQKGERKGEQKTEQREGQKQEQGGEQKGEQGGTTVGPQQGPREFVLPFPGRIWDVAVTPDGKLIVVGERYLPDGMTDGFILFVTFSGKIVWQRFFTHVLGFYKVSVPRDYYVVLGKVRIPLPDVPKGFAEVPYVLFLGLARCVLAEYVLPLYTDYGGSPITVVPRKDGSLVITSMYQDSEDRAYTNLVSFKPPSPYCDMFGPSLSLSYVKEGDTVKKVTVTVIPRFLEVPISQVSIGVNGETVANLTKEPFTFDLVEPKSGVYTISAVVKYADGRSAFAEQRIVIVTIPTVVTRDWSESFGQRLNEIATAVTPFLDGFVVTAWVEPEDEQTSDVYLMRISNTGKLLWVNTYGDAKNDGSWGLAITDDGGVVVAGWTEQEVAGGTDVYVLKVNANGGIVWESAFGEAGNDIGVSVHTASGGTLMVFGMSESGGALGSQLYVTKLDGNGKVVWQKKYGRTGVYNFLSNAIKTSRSTFLLVGNVIDQSGGTDGYVLEIDEDGRILWERVYQESGNQWLSSAVETDDGYMIVGHTKAYLIFEDGKPSGNDIYLLHVAKNGQVMKKRALMEPGEQRGYSIARTRDGQFLIGSSILAEGKPDWEMRVVKVNADFVITWDKTFERDGTDQLFGTQSLAVLGDGSCVLVGGSVGEANNWDLRIIKFLDGK